MSVAARISLFVLASLCLVIIPAVMLDTYMVIVRLTGQEQPLIAILSMLPLTIVLIGCIICLYVSLFRTHKLPERIPPQDDPA